MYADARMMNEQHSHEFTGIILCACMDTLNINVLSMHCYIKVVAMTYYMVVKAKENTPMKFVIVTKGNYYKVK